MARSTTKVWASITDQQRKEIVRQASRRKGAMVAKVSPEVQAERSARARVFEKMRAELTGRLSRGRVSG